MLNLVLYSLFLSAVPNKLDTLDFCCIDHPNKPTNPLERANYDCRMLDTFGKDRCNQVYGKGVCRWAKSKQCFRRICRRYNKYQLYKGKYVNVGECRGVCKDTNKKCKVNNYIKKLDSDDSLNIIKDCICDSCTAFPLVKSVPIRVDKCRGDCNNEQKDNVYLTGVEDQFSNSNGLEVSNPSSALISGMLSGCSAGIQQGFDIFIDNRCFGHTFIDCFNKGECPLKDARLKICLKAANVFLTQTDSLVLGINGSPLWGAGLPLLNGGSWNRHDEMCLDLNLGNLPGNGLNILLDIQMAGHLDVMVQDDTAVDFLKLYIKYDKCKRCIPKSSSISHLYTNGRIIDYLKNDDCSCIGIEECKKEDHYITYYKGTMFEKNVNVGQCIGKCQNNLRCNLVYEKYALKAPEGVRYIKKIQKCECGELLWNPLGLYLDEK
tara:strand:+ start:2811 stop:4112 length:1302 start_codon:yes stop_codon:yes gene_type:complete